MEKSLHTIEEEIDKRYSPGDITGRNDFRDGANWVLTLLKKNFNLKDE